MADLPHPPATGGHDFTAEGKALFVVSACGEATSAEAEVVPAARRAKHSAVVSKAQVECCPVVDVEVHVTRDTCTKP